MLLIACQEKSSPLSTWWRFESFKAEDRSRDANIANKVLAYDIAIDDRHALSASASYDKTDENCNNSIIEFTNDLVEGPYQASAKLSKSKNYDGHRKIAIQWKNEYWGTSPCETNLFHEYPGDISVNYMCDDAGNNKNLKLVLPHDAAKNDFQYQDEDNRK